MAENVNNNHVSKNDLENTVSAKGQLRQHGPVRIVERGGSWKVLFVGNSIMWHACLPKIGWYGDWGMAASCEEKDFIHRTVEMLDERYGKVDYCLAQLAEWEMAFPNGDGLLEEKFTMARDFDADLIVIRIGENFPKGIPYAEDCKEYFTRMIKFLHGSGRAKVVITDGFWKVAARDEMLRKIAADEGYTLCSINDLEDDPATMALNQYEHRGICVHPSDFGMEGIAKRIFATIETIL